MKTEAWKDLDAVARCTYIELKRRHHRHDPNNGRIALSVRQVADELGVAPATASRAFKSLEKHGFIVTMQKGAFRLKVRHATEWRLTEFFCDVTKSSATKDFASWKKITVHVVKPTVHVVKPIGARSETRGDLKSPPNSPDGFTTGTVRPNHCFTTCTLLDSPLPISASGSAVASASRASDAVGLDKVKRKPKPAAAAILEPIKDPT